MQDAWYAWLLEASTERCETNAHLKASTYIVPALVIVLLLSRSSRIAFVTLARVLAVLGTLTTLENVVQKRCGIHIVLLSLVLHFAPIYICASDDVDDSAFSKVVCLAVLLLTLGLYAAAKKWPYCVAPITLVGTSVAMLLVI